MFYVAHVWVHGLCGCVEVCDVGFCAYILHHTHAACAFDRTVMSPTRVFVQPTLCVQHIKVYGAGGGKGEGGKGNALRSWE